MYLDIRKRINKINLKMLVMLFAIFLSVNFAFASEKTEAKNLKIIAVREFDSNDKQLSKMMAEWTISVLFEKKDYKVVERMLLNDILSEHKLSESGIVNKDSMRKLGELTGASYILFGSIGKLGGKYLLTIKIVNADSAETIESYRGSTNNMDSLPNLLVSLLKKEQITESETASITIDNNPWIGYFQYDDPGRGYIKGNFTINFREGASNYISGDIVEPRTHFGPNTKTLHSIITDGHFDRTSNQIKFTKVYDYDGHTVNYVGTLVGENVMTGRWNIGSYTGSWRALRQN